MHRRLNAYGSVPMSRMGNVLLALMCAHCADFSPNLDTFTTSGSGGSSGTDGMQECVEQKCIDVTPIMQFTNQTIFNATVYDINDDSNVDLCAIVETGAYLLQGDGTGLLTKVAEYVRPYWSPGNGSVVSFGDIDADGQVDLVGVPDAESGSGLGVARGLGNFEFDDSEYVAPCGRPLVAEIDGEPGMEIVCWHDSPANGSPVGLYAARGGNVPPTAELVFDYSSQQNNIVAVNVGTNQSPKVVAVTWSPYPTDQWLTVVGDSNGFSVQTVGSTLTPNGYSGILAGQFRGDVGENLYVIDGTNPYLLDVASDGAVVEPPTEVLDHLATGTQIAGDVDADGNDDVFGLVVDSNMEGGGIVYSNPRFSIAFGDGNGGFDVLEWDMSSYVADSDLIYAQAVAAADFDNDGGDEIVVRTSLSTLVLVDYTSG